jgi:hypothetical protein
MKNTQIRIYISVSTNKVFLLQNPKSAGSRCVQATIQSARNYLGTKMIN